MEKINLTRWNLTDILYSDLEQQTAVQDLGGREMEKKKKGSGVSVG